MCRSEFVEVNVQKCKVVEWWSGRVVEWWGGGGAEEKEKRRKGKSKREEMVDVGAGVNRQGS